MCVCGGGLYLLPLGCHQIEFVHLWLQGLVLDAQILLSYSITHFRQILLHLCIGEGGKEGEREREKQEQRKGVLGRWGQGTTGGRVGWWERGGEEDSRDEEHQNPLHSNGKISVVGADLNDTDKGKSRLFPHLNSHLRMIMATQRSGRGNCIREKGSTGKQLKLVVLH